MAELKTKKNNASVNEFLDSVSDPLQRQDSYTILKMMEEITGEQPVMWGDSLVGFGNIRYQYSTGRGGDWMLTGFSPRKQNLTLYLMSGFDQVADLLSRLGKYKTGKGCLYIKRLSEVDLNVLQELIAQSIQNMRAIYPEQRAD